jgi:glycine reductase complex component B subunit gamma
VSEPFRVVMYLNQFFAGVGGEDKAETRPASLEGPVGPGVPFNQFFEGEGEVVATVYCGDNLMAEGDDQVVDDVIGLIREAKPDIVVAGPSFGSGRYGLACGKVCVAATERLGVPSVTGMHEESPGAFEYRAKVVIASTRETAAGMVDALKTMARVATKLAHGTALGSPTDEGTIPSGARKNEISTERGARRAVLMLLQKLRGEPFETELPLQAYERVPPAPPLSAPLPSVALVAEGGVVPVGNPDRIQSAWATRWGKYDVSGLRSLTESFESIHGGIDTTAGNERPDRLIPLDVMKTLEEEGRINLHPVLYATTGNMGALREMQRIGSEIAAELRGAGVDAAIVGST